MVQAEAYLAEIFGSRALTLSCDVDRWRGVLQCDAGQSRRFSHISNYKSKADPLFARSV